MHTGEGGEQSDHVRLLQTDMGAGLLVAERVVTAGNPFDLNFVLRGNSARRFRHFPADQYVCSTRPNK